MTQLYLYKHFGLSDNYMYFSWVTETLLLLKIVYVLYTRIGELQRILAWGNPSGIPRGIPVCKGFSKDLQQGFPYLGIPCCAELHIYKDLAGFLSEREDHSLSLHCILSHCQYLKGFLSKWPQATGYLAIPELFLGHLLDTEPSQWLCFIAIPFVRQWLSFLFLWLFP